MLHLTTTPLINSKLGLFSQNETKFIVDIYSSKKRKRIMSQIRSRNTTPELIVRKNLHSLGFRYRLHRKDLPGSPDIVLPKYKTVIFVNGCFWHQHSCKKGQNIPKTNSVFWENKLRINKLRDKRNIVALKKLGWDVLVVWECETKKIEWLTQKLLKSLRNQKDTP